MGVSMKNIILLKRAGNRWIDVRLMSGADLYWVPYREGPMGPI